MLVPILAKKLFQLNPVYRFSFDKTLKDAFTVGSQLNRFQQEVKLKYLQDPNISKLDKETLQKKITQQFDELQERLTQEGGVLTKLKRGLFSSQEEVPNEQDNKQNDKNEESTLYKQASKYFNSLSNEQFLNRTRNLKQSYLNNQELSIHQPLSTSTQYGNYSVFEQSIVSVRDQQIANSDNYGQAAYSGQNIEEFIQSLNQDYSARRGLDETYKKEQKHKPGLSREEIETLTHDSLDYQAKLREKDYITAEEQQNFYEDMIEDEEECPLYCLSPDARKQIFDLYEEGWSVKDLSDRYGIHPSRTKAVIYLNSIYYYEMVPRVSYTQLRQFEESEQHLQEMGYIKYVDYGIDLDLLIQNNQGAIVPSFSQFRDADVAALDADKDPSVVSQLKRKMDNKQRQFKIVGIIGEGSSSYIMKEMNVLKGRGSQNIQSTFQRILKHSHQPQRLPVQIAQQLNKGPRLASSQVSSF